MKHSDYLNLTGWLRNLAREADHTRAILNDENKGGYLGMIWRTIDGIDKTDSEFMDFWVDGWTNANQDRADRGLGPTADLRKLFVAMNEFIRATDTPVARWGVLYPGMRHRCRQWIDQAVEWFPNLNETDGTIAPTQRPVVTVKVDRKRLANCFVDEFKKKDGATGDIQPFKNFVDDFVHRSRIKQYSFLDIGRVAWQIQKSGFLQTYLLLRIRKGFAPWFRLFCEICDVAIPENADLSRTSTYSRVTPDTDFSGFLGKPKRR